jgi:hypothetical protein
MALILSNYYQLFYFLGLSSGSKSPAIEQADNTITVLPSERAQYSAIIDVILANSDLNTISARRIRAELELKLGVDVSEKKVGYVLLHHIPTGSAGHGSGI